MPFERPAVAIFFAQWIAMFSAPMPERSFGANSWASSMTRWTTPRIPRRSAGAKSTKNRCNPPGSKSAMSMIESGSEPPATSSPMALPEDDGRPTCPCGPPRM